MNTTLQPTHISSPNFKRFELLLSLAGTWILTWVLFQTISLAESTTVQPYIIMAQDPYKFVAFPYGSRILTPLLVYYLPFGVDDGFRIIAFCGFWLTGILLYILIRHFCSQVILSFGIITLFYLSPTVQFLTANAWYIDPLSYVFMCIGLLGAFHIQRGIVMAGFTFGVWNRPSSIIFIPAALLLCWSNQTRFRNILWSLLILLPEILCIFMILYIWPHASNYGVAKQSIENLSFTDTTQLSEIYSQQGLLYLFSPMIYQELLPCIWGTILLGMMYCNRKILFVCLFIIIASILPMVAATDYFRLPFYAFPALFILSGIGFEQLYTLKPPVSLFWLALCILIMFVFPQSLPVGLVISGLMVVNFFVLKKANA